MCESLQNCPRFHQVWAITLGIQHKFIEQPCVRCLKTSKLHGDPASASRPEEGMPV